MLGREVVEGEQRVAVLAEAIGRLFVFRRVALDEGVECQFGGTDICSIWPYNTRIAILQPSANLSPVPTHLGW